MVRGNYKIDIESNYFGKNISVSIDYNIKESDYITTEPNFYCSVTNKYFVVGFDENNDVLLIGNRFKTPFSVDKLWFDEKLTGRKIKIV